MWRRASIKSGSTRWKQVNTKTPLNSPSHWGMLFHFVKYCFAEPRGSKLFRPKANQAFHIYLSNTIWFLFGGSLNYYIRRSNFRLLNQSKYVVSLSSCLFWVTDQIDEDRCLALGLWPLVGAWSEVPPILTTQLDQLLKRQISNDHHDVYKPPFNHLAHLVRGDGKSASNSKAII